MQLIIQLEPVPLTLTCCVVLDIEVVGLGPGRSGDGGRLNAALLPVIGVGAKLVALADIDGFDATIGFDAESVAVLAVSDGIALGALGISFVSWSAAATFRASRPTKMRFLHRRNQFLHRWVAGGNAAPGRRGGGRTQQNFASPFARSSAFSTKEEQCWNDEGEWNTKVFDVFDMHGQPTNPDRGH